MPETSARPLRQTALNDGWQFRRANNPDWDWLPAQTPGHVHLDLLANGIIAHPFDSQHEKGVQWVDEVDWEYRLVFSGRAGASGERQVLHFAGLDTVCQIWLNGEEVAASENMFIPVEIDVTGKLAEQNDLLIRFAAPRRIAKERKAAYFAETGLRPETVSFYDWTFLRKAPYMFGWDWGPKLASVGIWKPVYLMEYAARITDVWVRQVHSDGAVTLHLSGEAEGKGEFQYTLTGPQGFRQEAAGEQAEIQIENPQLWWPNNEGAQPLYTLTTRLVADGVTIDERTQRVGLRTIEFLQEPDEHGECFAFRVNGRPIWCRGANWIPDDSFPSILKRDRIFAQIERARQMNSNMLRVWGGGTYESDDFYDACDEKGILVWQDFAFGCSYSPDTDEYIAAYEAEGRHAVKSLRSRTSLALWCGNNEVQMVWEGKWGGAEFSPERFHGQRVWDEVLRDVASELDPDRSYIATSPMGAEGDCNGGGCGDQHYWDVWHGRGDWKHYAESTARFSSEFGFASSPSLAAWYKHLRPDELQPRSAAVRWHDKTLKGYETYLGYTGLHYPPIESMEDLVYYTQLNQRDAMRFALEHYRCSACCRGALIWQLNDCWPVQSWALIDSEKRIKFAGHEMRRCFAPQMLAVLAGESEIEIWAVNDGAAELTIEAAIKMLSPQTGELWLENTAESVTLASDSRQKIATLTRPEQNCLVVVEGAGLRVARLVGEPKETTFGSGRLEIQRSEDRLRLTASEAPLVDLWLRTDDDGTVFDQNGLTLLPGESIDVGFSGSLGNLIARCLGQPRVRVGFV